MNTNCENRGVWVPDLGNGQYKNPIIYADYSDPDIVRSGEDFYMIASSFNCVPGLPVLHSKDLVNWSIINHIVKEIPLPGYDRPLHGKGLWAPTIKYHGGRFWVYVCTPDEGLFMSNAEDPAGEWSPLCHVKKVTGWIDPCPFWDDDGQGYLIHAFANSRVGISSILHLCKLSQDGTGIIDDGRIVIDANGRHHVMEGPRMFKRNGYYYISAPAGGIKHGYQVTMRSENIYGPYEERIAVHEGSNSINGPRQGGFVELDSGETWFVHFQHMDAYGRVVNLEPVTWKDDWMIIGEDEDGDGIGEPVEIGDKPDVNCAYPLKVPQTSDEFDDKEIGLQWQWHGNVERHCYSLTEKEGWLRLFSKRLPDKGTTIYDTSNLLLQKFPSPAFDAETKLIFSPEKETDICGLMVSGQEYHYLSLRKKDGKLNISVIKGFEEEGFRKEKNIETKSIEYKDSMEIYLKVSVQHGGICNFSYSLDGVDYKNISGKFNAVPGVWIGSKVGIFCINMSNETSSGFADFDWFRIS